MKIFYNSDIISKVIKTENKFALHIDPILELQEETWKSFVDKIKTNVKEKDCENILSAIIHAPTIFFFDTQDEMLDYYYKYFHVKGILYGKVIATIYDNNGVMLDGTF